MAVTRLLIPLLTLACVGCAGIQVKSFDGSADAMKGIPYVLPMTVYTLTITRRVVDCDPIEGMQSDIQVAVASKTVPDPAAMFTLSSNGFFDTSDIKVIFDTNGATSAMNTAVADQSGAVITQTVATVAGLSAIKLGGGRGLNNVCAVAIVKALNAIGRDKYGTNPAVRGLKDDVAVDSAKLIDIAGQIALVSSQITALGQNADLKNEDVKLRKKLVDLLDQQRNAQVTLNGAQDKLTKALAVITNTRTVQWPKDGRQWVSGGSDNSDLGIPDEVWKDWTKGSHVADNKKAQFQVFLKIERLGRWGQVIVKNQLPEVVADRGIPVRFPVPAILHVCKDAPCGDSGSTEIKSLEGPVLQFGLVYGVPATGGIFASTTFALQLGADGEPTSVEVANQSAVAAGASGAASQVAGIPAAIRAAELSEVTAESGIATGKNTIANANATALTISQLAPLQANGALLQAQVAQVTAENTLMQAQATNSNVAQLAPIQADTALAQAQTAQLAAAKALAVAKQVTGSAN